MDPMTLALIKKLGGSGGGGGSYTLTDADKQEIAELAADLVPSGGGGASCPLLYDVTTTEEVRWIDTGKGAFEAKHFLIVELLAVATSSNEAKSAGCCSIHPTIKTDPSQFYPWDNYVVAKSIDSFLRADANMLFRAVGVRGENGDWSFAQTVRSVANDGQNTPLMKTSRLDNISNQSILGLIIGDASAAAGTRVLGVGSRLRVWGY